MMAKPELPEITVSAETKPLDYWKEVWRYRELLYLFSWRDLKVRYKQTVIGIAWAALRPLLTLIIFTFVFGKVAGLESDSAVPYPLLVLSGVLAWQLFSSSVSESAASLLGNERLLTKVYFPRIIIPLSTLATCLVDFTIAAGLSVLLFVYYGCTPSLFVVFFPLWLLLTLLLAISIGLGLAALNVRFRDFRYALPFALQVGLFLSPVGYSADAVPGKYQLLYDLNPVVGVIEGLRWCCFGTTWSGFPVFAVLITLAWIFVGLLLSIPYFKKTERTFADII